MLEEPSDCLKRLCLIMNLLDYSGYFDGGRFRLHFTAFLVAGSPRVVASWSSQHGTALALGHRDMMASRVDNEATDSPFRFTHPYFWTPFILVGDWRKDKWFV